MSGQLLAGPQGFFYLACALILLASAVIVVVLKPVLGLWALAAVFATEEATPIPLDTSLLRAGATHLYPADVLSVVLLLATLVFLIRRPPPARIMVPLSVAGTVFAVNLYRGVTQFGLQHATNESREWFYFLVTVAFVVTAGPWGPRFWKPWFGLAVAVTGLAWLGLARHGLHPTTSTIMINGQPVDPRPLTGAGAIALALALIALLGSRAITPRRKTICAAVLVGTLVLVQQRTVWVVLAVAFLLWAAASLHRRSTAQHRRLTVIGVEPRRRTARSRGAWSAGRTCCTRTTPERPSCSASPSEAATSERSSGPSPTWYRTASTSPRCCGSGWSA